ncbi:hypothetical protein [Gemmatimonas sp.]|uniref:hypothetical protein n=1 Tax=Gemmatimonas sp. TaxID=1962908 RepID=UPI003561C6BE
MTAGGVAAWGALAAAGAIDVVVMVKGADSITAACRRHPVTTAIVVGAFVCHLAERPRAFVAVDPFCHIGGVAGWLTARAVKL